MKIISTIILSAVIAGVPAASGAEVKDGKAPAASLDEIIFDAPTFVAALPKKTLVYFNTPENAREAQAGIKALGAIPDVEFLNLPPATEPPEMKDQTSPNTRRLSGSGDASFLAIITAKGTIAGLFCYATNNKAFAVNAAAAISRWRFKPARIQKTSVPVLFATTLSFDSHSSFH